MSRAPAPPAATKTVPAEARETGDRQPQARATHGIASTVLRLQRLAGNAAVRSCLGARTAPVPSGAVVQRKVVRVPEGGASSSTWVFLYTADGYDYYDDGQPEVGTPPASPGPTTPVGPTTDTDDELADAPEPLTNPVDAWDDLVEELRQWAFDTHGDDLSAEAVDSTLVSLGLSNPRSPELDIDEDELGSYLMDVSSMSVQFKSYYSALKSDEPVYSVDELHLRMSQALAGSQKKRVSQNEVVVSLALVVINEQGEKRVVLFTVPKKFASGGFGAPLEKRVKTWLVATNVIRSAGDYSHERHAHSEQEMVQYLIDNRAALALRLVGALVAGESVLQVVLNLVSLPNTVCTPCHRSVDALMRIMLLPSITGTMHAYNVSGAPDCIVNVTATNKFPGGFATEGGDFASFNEQLLQVVQTAVARNAFKTIFDRARAQLLKVTVGLGQVFALHVEGSPRQLLLIPVGMEFPIGNMLFRVVGVDASSRTVNLQLAGVVKDNVLHTAPWTG